MNAKAQFSSGCLKRHMGSAECAIPLRWVMALASGRTDNCASRNYDIARRVVAV